MRIKLLTAMADFRRVWPAGAVINHPDDDALRLIERGHAEPVRDESPPDIPAPTRGEQTVRRPNYERRGTSRSINP